jgi:hypothetical protein
MAYGFPPIVIPIIGAATALISVAGVAGGGALAKTQRTEAYYAQIGLTNPAVAALNAQIAGIKDGSVLTRWASPGQRDEHARKEQLMAQRDALIGAGVVAPTDPNAIYYYIGGAAVFLAVGTAVAVLISRTGGSRRNPRRRSRRSRR